MKKGVISFKDYYIDQFRRIPECWRLAKSKGKRRYFFPAVAILLFPHVVYYMWLYDTGQMKVDPKYGENKEETE